MIVWLASYPKSGNTWLRMFLRSYFLKNETQFSLNVKGNDVFEAQTFPNIKMLKNVSVNPTKFMDIAKNWINMQEFLNCLLYTSPSPRDATLSRMPSSA